MGKQQRCSTRKRKGQILWKKPSLSFRVSFSLRTTSFFWIAVLMSFYYRCHFEVDKWRAKRLLSSGKKKIVRKERTQQKDVCGRTRWLVSSVPKCTNMMLKKLAGVMCAGLGDPRRGWSGWSNTCFGAWRMSLGRVHHSCLYVNTCSVVNGIQYSVSLTNIWTWFTRENELGD